jgi:glutamate N-acetyltransferase / amino-acid N-acetyltransferase
MTTLTTIDGVYASGIHSGIKKTALDLAYIYVPDAVASAGTFTQHAFSASSVLITRKNMSKHTLKAVIINSGNANAGTGEQGARDTKTCIKHAATLLGLQQYEVGMSSTGIIGVPLPVDTVKTGLTTLLSDKKQRSADKAAEAILTTDLFPKSVYREKKIGKKRFQISGITKGSGMIAPNMATMLAYVVVNADISSKQLQTWLSEAVEESFNMISVDTDTSTSDMVLAFATGEHKFSLTDQDSTNAFKELLTEVCIDLAKLIIKDGEGSKKTIEVTVEGAVDKDQAKKCALNVANSPLVKTAIHGEDPNWGRLIMAIGKDPSLKVTANKVDILIGDIEVFKQGNPVDFDENAVKAVLSLNYVPLHIHLNIHKGRARAWGCELTKGYIDINTDYN